MKTSQALQEMVTKLADQNGLDLNAPQAYLGLILGESHRLEIEKVGERVIRVIYYRKNESEGDLFSHEITCFISDAGWIPIERSHYLGMFYVYAELTPDHNGVVAIDQCDQTELAEFVDTLVPEIEAYGGFAQASKWEPRRPKQTQPPSLEQLVAWIDEDGCEATDGCWVEHDGTCPHGCQSWFIVLGLI